MLARGVGMGLEIPLPQADVDAILRLRDTELKRFVLLHFVTVEMCSCSRLKLPFFVWS
jgi:hypothetical protein